LKPTLGVSNQRVRKENSQLVSSTNQLKLKASDGKFYETDTFDAEGISLLMWNEGFLATYNSMWNHR